jgi:hypothetical protein
MGFSARISLSMFVDGASIAIAQVGPKTVRLRQPDANLVGKHARLVIQVGNGRKTQDIFLTGTSGDDPLEMVYL